MASELSGLVRWLNARALREGRLIEDETEESREAYAILEAARTGHGHNVGVELHKGTFLTTDVRRIGRKAVFTLRRLSTLMEYIDDFGYTPLAVRELLNHHVEHVAAAPLGTEAFAVYLDLVEGYRKLTTEDRHIVEAIIMGESRDSIAVRLETGGTRGIFEAVRALSRAMGG